MQQVEAALKQPVIRTPEDAKNQIGPKKRFSCINSWSCRRFSEKRTINHLWKPGRRAIDDSRPSKTRPAATERCKDLNRLIREFAFADGGAQCVTKDTAAAILGDSSMVRLLLSFPGLADL